MIMHLDMDAFFASIEQLDNKELAGKPVVVGGKERGVVSTASYEARVYGIHSAMPMTTAHKLCPHAFFVPGRYHRYSQVSNLIMNCLREISPCIQPASIDEAYLAMPPEADPLEMALRVKKAVKEVSGGLTCSVGVASVKFLAKICSDMHKPDGIFILPDQQADEFLLGLNVAKIPGVGKKMASSLAAFGIETVRQLRALSQEFLEERYGKFGRVLYERGRGLDSRTVHENPPPKSEGRERTFAVNIRDREILKQCIREQAEKVASRLAQLGLKGRTITLKVKFADFQQITRSRTLERRVNSSEDITLIGHDILAAIHLHQPVRLLGICVSGFEYRPEQLPLPGLPAYWLKKTFHSRREE